MSSATYHQNYHYSGSNYELSSVLMLKHTHTTINIFHSKHHTNRSDLIETATYDDYGTRRHIVTDDRSKRSHLATVLVDMWSLKSGQEYYRDITFIPQYMDWGIGGLGDGIMELKWQLIVSPSSGVGVYI